MKIIIKNLPLILTLVILFSSNYYAQIYVNTAASGNDDGTTWADAFNDLQSALSAANYGDEIWVAKGTYKPSIEVGGSGTRYQAFQMINGVEIYGGFSGTETATSERVNYGAGEANETILSGDIGNEGDNTDNCYHVFNHPFTSGSGLTSSAILDGFTISGGNANITFKPNSMGGGMSNLYSSPTITNCTFSSNLAYSGGAGMYNENSSPTITGCTFSANEASGASNAGGGGLRNYKSSPTITDCTFSNNFAVNLGGGMSTHTFGTPISSPTVTNCTFSSNTSGHHGGGVYNKGTSTFINCTFSNNSGSSNVGAGGGGVYNESFSPTYTNCLFVSNDSYEGAGIYNYGSSPNLNNCTISLNSATNGGGIYNSHVVINNISPTLNNCIVWGNSAVTSGNQFYIGHGTTTLNYSCYGNSTNDVVVVGEGVFTATNNCITTDPQFVDSAGDDFRITQNSVCADAGNDGYNSETTDIRGNGFGRKLLYTDYTTTGTIDIGAYEYNSNVDPVSPLPVELISFTAMVNIQNVELNWQTATEIDNYGFSVERSAECKNGRIDDWKEIGFVQGHGNSNSSKEYSFTDNNPASGTLYYRLKQIDNDGAFEYSKEIEVENNQVPTEFLLSQNYPNPFNPTTQIRFAIPEQSKVVLKIYDVLGKEVATLVNNLLEEGNYNSKFTASNLSSGVYFYRLQTGSFTQIKKMNLIK